MQKKLAVIIGGVALAVAAAASFAAEVFTVDPLGLPAGTTAPLGSETTFQADAIAGTSSEYIVCSGGLGCPNQTATGFLNFTGFSLGAAPVLPGTSGLGIDYQLYVTFELDAVLSSGAGAPAPGSIYDVTALTFEVWADINTDNVFTGANAAGDSPTNISNIGDDVLLASGDILFSGVAGINDELGVFINTTSNFVLTAAGDAFFVDPVPFYNLVFSGFNNTQQGIAATASGNLVIESAAGIIQFQRVPEPGSLGLLGLALAGLGFATRRQKKLGA